jgi:hypothetical protein
MPHPDPTAANVDLWRSYVRTFWGPFLRPFGGPNAADTVADGLARLYGLAMGGAIEQLYNENAPDVTRFVDARRLIAGVEPTPTTNGHTKPRKRRARAANGAASRSDP